MSEEKVTSQQNENVTEGWHDETSSREQALNFFLKNYFSKFEDRKNYGSNLHFSGGGGDVNFSDITGQVVRINVLYEYGRPVQLHAELRAKGRETGVTDVYLTKGALEDYLS